MSSRSVPRMFLRTMCTAVLPRTATVCTEVSKTRRVRGVKRDGTERFLLPPNSLIGVRVVTRWELKCRLTENCPGSLVPRRSSLPEGLLSREITLLSEFELDPPAARKGSSVITDCFTPNRRSIVFET
eukprot:1184004-Prorocentrum_minimum.AAC.3